MQVWGYLSDFILASDSDLCVLLSNALENALHACAPLVEAGQDCVIDVNFHERGKKFFLQITNPCQQEKVRLVKGIPVTDQPGHGLGVQSICSVVAKYGPSVHVYAPRTFYPQGKQYIKDSGHTGEVTEVK